MFSYIDLVRVEIALEVGEQFGVDIPDEETDNWHTLGDVTRSVVERANGGVAESVVFDWVRTLLTEGYGVSTELTIEGDVFGDYDQVTAWFMAPPLSYRLGDRWFAKKREERPAGSGDVDV